MNSLVTYFQSLYLFLFMSVYFQQSTTILKTNTISKIFRLRSLHVLLTSLIFSALLACLCRSAGCPRIAALQSWKYSVCLSTYSPTQSHVVSKCRLEQFCARSFPSGSIIVRNSLFISLGKSLSKAFALSLLVKEFCSSPAWPSRCFFPSGQSPAPSPRPSSQ